jgi:hypothetical protein
MDGRVAAAWTCISLFSPPFFGRARLERGEPILGLYGVATALTEHRCAQDAQVNGVRWVSGCLFRAKNPEPSPDRRRVQLNRLWYRDVHAVVEPPCLTSYQADGMAVMRRRSTQTAVIGSIPS